MLVWFVCSGGQPLLFKRIVDLSHPIIPGEAVREGGVEYYIKVENSGVYATDPPGAPEQGVFYQAVKAPSEVASFAQPNTGTGFMEARAIRVELELAKGAQFQEGTLYYRPGGAADYTSQDLTAEDVGFAETRLVATIAGTSFGETNTISSVIYILVGVAAIWLVPTLARWVTQSEEPVTA